MKILLTGHKGFIGSRLLKELEKDNEMFLSEDIMNDTLPDVDIVYHLGAKAYPEKSKIEPFWDMDNITTSLKIATQYRDKKIIYTNSFLAKKPYKSPYAISKMAGGEYIKYFCKNSVVIITPLIYDNNIDKFVKFLVKTKDFKPGTYKFKESASRKIIRIIKWILKR